MSGNHAWRRTSDAGHRTTDGEKSKNNISTPQGGGHNDLCNISSVLKFILFADDSNLFYSNENLNVLFEVMNKELQTLTTWFSVNRLSLNVKKTNYILFSNKNVKKFKGQIKIDSTEVDRVENTKFLGIIIDEKLNWKDQILHIENKVSRGIGLMFRQRSIR